MKCESALWCLRSLLMFNEFSVVVELSNQMFTSFHPSLLIDCCQVTDSNLSVFYKEKLCSFCDHPISVVQVVLGKRQMLSYPMLCACEFTFQSSVDSSSDACGLSCLFILLLMQFCSFYLRHNNKLLTLQANSNNCRVNAMAMKKKSNAIRWANKQTTNERTVRMSNISDREMWACSSAKREKKSLKSRR